MIKRAFSSKSSSDYEDSQLKVDNLLGKVRTLESGGAGVSPFLKRVERSKVHGESTFRHILVKDVMRVVPMILLDENMSLDEALEALSRKTILSAPICHVGEEQMVTGIVSVGDLVKFFLDHLSSEQAAESTHLAYSLFHQTTLKEVVDKGFVGEWKPVYEEDSLVELLHVFSEGFHRVPVFTRVKFHGEMQDHVLGVVSQTNVLSYIYQHKTLLDKVGSQTVQSLNLYLPSEHIVSVAPSVLTLKAFQLLRDANVSAIAIVEDETLVGQLSIQHFKGITVDKLDLLGEPVNDFVLAVSPGKRHAHVTCTASSTVHDVVALMSSNKAHRCWVVEQGKLIGLISLSDLLTCIHEQCKQEQP